MRELPAKSDDDSGGHYPGDGAHPKSFAANLLLKCVPTRDCTLPATLKRSNPVENRNCFTSSDSGLVRLLQGHLLSLDTDWFSVKRP